MLQPFWLAVQFLTRLPTPSIENASDSQMGASVQFYPLVGFLIGVLLIATVWLTQDFGDSVQAALLLTCWVMITGGLHLDGLADCADAWAGGLSSKERTLAIMKDPAAGPIAVIALILVLLIKWSALTSLLAEQNFLMLLGIPVLGRLTILAMMLSTPYVRQNGLGTKMQENFPVTRVWMAVFIGSLVCIWILGFTAIVVAVFVVWLLRRLVLQRLGGATGDVYGAILELGETAALVAVAL
jgi:adenosylcobinamide-GDP ribazoletransferase